MIKGHIEDGLYPRIKVFLFSGDNELDVKALVASGFDGDLGLNYKYVDLLHLEIEDIILVEYANGRIEEEISCTGYLKWFDMKKKVQITLSDDEESTIGTRLLQGSVVTMDFIKNLITITQDKQRETAIKKYREKKRASGK